MPSSGTKKQLKFGHRRHIAKPRTSLGSMETEKRQSSLTQLDFVSTPQPSSEVIRIPDTDDEDEEFVVEQPKKKRRVSSNDSADNDWTPNTTYRTSVRRRSDKIKRENGREKGQQTMTQIDFVPSAQRQRIVGDIEDDQGEMFHGSDEETVQKTRPLDFGRKKRTLPWLDQADDTTEDTLASKNARSPTKESRRHSPSKVVHQPLDLALHSIATHDFTTPKKVVRHLEIPSSQSPPSITMSTKRSQRSGQPFVDQESPSKAANTPQRSPLKEKSANIAPRRWQPETQESQNPTMKMLQQVRLRTKMGKAPLHEEPPMPPPKRPKSQVLVEASQNGDPPSQMQPPPRKLRRIATVQDSQGEDENIMTQAAAPAKLNRVSTIQDSQLEDLDLSSQLYRSISSRENPRDFESQLQSQSQAYNEDYDDNEFDDPGPHTYDPVSAALDRDAARYAWTQTQAPFGASTQRPRTQVEDSEAESDDDDDLDRGIVPDSDSEDEVILLPNPSKEPSQELCSDDFSRERDLIPTRTGTENISPAKPEKQTSRSTSNSPPSSPPALRPSQVSTIAPTQSSPQRNLAPEEEEEDNNSYSPPTSPPRPFSAAKKRRPETQALTISSSPLPLPPWSSSGEQQQQSGPQSDAVQTLKQEGGNGGCGNDDLDTLVDFSLPPPPPLGASSSPWR